MQSGYEAFQSMKGKQQPAHDEDAGHDGCGTWEKYQVLGFSLVRPGENGAAFYRGVGYDELVIKPSLEWRGEKPDSKIIFRVQNDDGKFDYVLEGRGEDFRKIHRHLMLGKRFTIVENGKDVIKIREIKRTGD